MMKKAGRPKRLKDATQIKLFVEPRHIEIAKRIGGDNISRGVRVALELADKQKEKLSD